MLDADPVQTEEQPVAPTNTAERKRGGREARLRILQLQKRWPALFRDDPRPLASSCVREVAAEMGWSISFTRPVLFHWKMSAAYCRAVLEHQVRVNLDGSPSAEVVDDKARALAQANLDQKRGQSRPRPRAPVLASQPAPIVAEPAAPPPPAAIVVVQPVPVPEPTKPTPAETRRAAQLKLMALAKKRVRR